MKVPVRANLKGVALMDQYYYNVLGQILQKEQPRLREMIDMRFDSGYEFEGTTIYSFESLRIHEAVHFLEDEWEYLVPFFE